MSFEARLWLAADKLTNANIATLRRGAAGVPPSGGSPTNDRLKAGLQQHAHFPGFGKSATSAKIAAHGYVIPPRPLHECRGSRKQRHSRLAGIANLKQASKAIPRKPDYGR